MHSSVFTEISLVIALAAGVSLIMKLIRQPLIIGHILTGIIAGPTLLGIIHDDSAFSGLSSMGVALLLFIIGLDLSLRIFARVGKVVALTTMAQILATTWIGFIVARFLNFDRLESVIIGIGLSLSSTIIIVKILNDKKETTRLYAQIAIGVLLLQDVVATGAKIGLAAKHGNGDAVDVTFLLARGLAVTLMLYLASRFIIPKLTRSLESSKELLLLFSLGWGLGIASLFEHVGFSIEIGALFAGVSLASLPYSHEMASRLKPLRDFFLVVFFITLGQSMAPEQMLDALPAALCFGLVVILIKPLAILAPMGMFGYTKRNSFKAAVALSQISEFSLVFMAAALSAGLISQEAVTAFTVAALVTFASSTYFMKYDDELYELLESKLRFFERKVADFEQKDAHTAHNIVLFGYRKGGSEFIRTFKAMAKKFIVVDYDPDVIDILERHQTSYIYGDAVDVELFEEIDLDKAKLVVSTISDHKTNAFLAHWLKKHNPAAVFVCSADSALHASDLYADGASYVMMPHYIGSEKLSAFIKKKGFSKTEFKQHREKHLAHLHARYDPTLDP